MAKRTGQLVSRLQKVSKFLTVFALSLQDSTASSFREPPLLTSMTTNELIQHSGRHSLVLAAGFVALPLVAWLVGRMHADGHGGTPPWKYLYAGLVYLVCVPGIFAAVITAYLLFFIRGNLLEVNPLVHFLPIVAMLVTLVFIRQRVTFDEVPGFHRLSGLMTMVACTFAIALAIQKTHIFLFFGGSIERLLALAIGVFALLKWGSHMLFRTRNEPKPERPKFTV